MSTYNPLPVPVVDLTQDSKKKQDQQLQQSNKITIDVEDLEEGEEIVDIEKFKKINSLQKQAESPKNKSHHHHHHRHHSRRHHTSKSKHSPKFHRKSSSQYSDSPSSLKLVPALLKFQQDESTLAKCVKTINPADNQIQFEFTEKNISKQIINYNAGVNSKSLLTQEKNLVQVKLSEFFKPEIEEKDEDSTPQQEPQAVTRYYYSNPEIHCRRCKEPGHYEAFCPQTPLVRCSYCLGNHPDNQCQNFLCFVCSEFGHKNINCPRFREQKCARCFKGHQGLCGKVWIQTNWKRNNEIQRNCDKIRCITCGWENHANCGVLQVDTLYEIKNKNDDFIVEEVN